MATRAERSASGGGRALVAVALLLAVAAVYAGVRHHDFVNYDDPIDLVEDPLLREPLGLRSALSSFTRIYHDNWIPLTWLSLRLGRALHGPAPAGFLVTNALLHALASALLYLALLRMTRQPGPSAFVAAVFAVHPLHVESVAWAAERKDVLCGLFWMLALCAHAHLAERSRSPARQAAVLACVAAALLAKPMAVTLPFALLLLDYWPLGRLAREGAGRIVLEKLPGVALCAGAAGVTWAAQGYGGALGSGEAFPLGARLANAADTSLRYAVAGVWPRDLAIFYPFPERVAWPRLLAAATWLLAMSAAAWVWRRRRPWLAVGWLWYLGTLLPVIGLIQVGSQARADRYTYLPLVGLSICAAWGGRELARRVDLPGVARIALAATALLALGSVAREQVAVWRDSRTLFAHALAATGENPLTLHQLGSALLADGEIDAAQRRFRRAAELRPGWPPPRIGLAEALAAGGRVDEAIGAYRTALQLDRDHVQGHVKLGLLLLRAERGAEAEAQLERSLALVPAPGDARARAVAHFALAERLRHRGRREEAVALYRAGLAEDPQSAQGHGHLGLLLVELERLELAEAHLRRALAGGWQSPRARAALESLRRGPG